MTCQEVKDVIRRMNDGLASGTEVVASERHISTCPPCKRMVQERQERVLAMARAAVAQRGNPEAAPDPHDALQKQVVFHLETVAKLVGEHERRDHGGEPCRDSRFYAVVNLAHALGLDLDCFAEIGAFWLRMDKEGLLA